MKASHEDFIKRAGAQQAAEVPYGLEKEYDYSFGHPVKRLCTNGQFTLSSPRSISSCYVLLIFIMLYLTHDSINHITMRIGKSKILVYSQNIIFHELIQYQ